MNAATRWDVPAQHNVTLDCQGASLVLAGGTPLLLAQDSNLVLERCNVLASTAIVETADSLAGASLSSVLGFKASTGVTLMMRNGRLQLSCQVREHLLAGVGCSFC